MCVCVCVCVCVFSHTKWIRSPPCERETAYKQFLEHTPFSRPAFPSRAPSLCLYPPLFVSMCVSLEVFPCHSFSFSLLLPPLFFPLMCVCMCVFFSVTLSVFPCHTLSHSFSFSLYYTLFFLFFLCGTLFLSLLYVCLSFLSFLHSVYPTDLETH